MADTALITELLEALILAQRWLVNCIPVTDLDGPKPAPVVAAAIAKAKRALAPHPARTEDK